MLIMGPLVCNNVSYSMNKLCKKKKEQKKTQHVVK